MGKALLAALAEVAVEGEGGAGTEAVGGGFALCPKLSCEGWREVLEGPSQDCPSARASELRVPWPARHLPLG